MVTLQFPPGRPKPNVTRAEPSMDEHVIRCPECGARLTANPGADGRVWCTACDAVFEVPTPRRAPGAARPTKARGGPTRRRRPADPEDDKRTARPRLLVLAVVVAAGSFGLGAAGVLGYYLLKKDGPPAQTAAADNPPPAAKKEEPRKENPKEEPNPPQPEPKKAPQLPPEPPKAPDAEEVLRRVKAATVYIRTTAGPGRVGMGTGFFAGGPGYVVTNAHVVGYGPAEVRT